MEKKEIVIIDTPHGILELSYFMVEKVDSFLIQEIFEEVFIITRGRIFNPMANENEFREIVSILLKHKGEVYTKHNLEAILQYVNLLVLFMLEYFTDSSLIMAEYIIENINEQTTTLRKLNEE